MKRSCRGKRVSAVSYQFHIKLIVPPQPAVETLPGAGLYRTFYCGAQTSAPTLPGGARGLFSA